MITLSAIVIQQEIILKKDDVFKIHNCIISTRIHASLENLLPIEFKNSFLSPNLVSSKS